MKNKTLTNIYTGEHIGKIDGNIVRTPIGTYRIGDSDLQWLINEAVKRRNFSAMDVKAVGFLIYEDEDEGEQGKWFNTSRPPHDGNMRHHAPRNGPPLQPPPRYRGREQQRLLS